MEKKYLLMFTLLLLTACQEEENFLRLELTGNISTPHYFVMVQLGTPPQMQMLQIDTGSNYLAFHCSSCKTETCRQSQLPLYNPGLSKTSATIPCSKDNFDCMNKCSSGGQIKPCLISSYYGTYSSMYKGDLYQDEFDFFTTAQQEGRAFTAPFICSQYSNAGESVKQIKHTQNGILGLGPDPLLNPLFYWFQQKQPNAAKVFSVCLADEGGYLQVGANPTLSDIKGDLSFEIGKAFYVVQGIKSMHLGDTLLSSEETLNKNRIAIDTGSTQQYIQSEAYTKFTNILLNICSMNTVTCDSSNWAQSQCFVIETSNIKGPFLDYLDSFFPPLIINIGSINITTPPSVYMRVWQGDVASQVCSLVRPSPIDKTIILGRNWQRNQKITFDLDNKKITIVPNSDCTFQRQSLNYRTNTSFKSIIISYSILLGMIVFILGGSSLCFWCSRFNNRLVKKPIQLVEENQQNSAPASIE